MTAKDIIELVKSATRPAIVLAFVGVFLAIIWKIAEKFMNAQIAGGMFDAFSYALTLIIGTWIGSRLAKPPTETQPK